MQGLLVPWLLLFQAAFTAPSDHRPCHESECFSVVWLCYCMCRVCVDIGIDIGIVISVDIAMI